MPDVVLLSNTNTLCICFVNRQKAIPLPKRQTPLRATYEPIVFICFILSFQFPSSLYVYHLPYSSGQSNLPVQPQHNASSPPQSVQKSAKSGVVHRLSRLACWGCGGGRSKQSQAGLAVGNSTLAPSPIRPNPLPPHTHSSDHIDRLLMDATIAAIGIDNSQAKSQAEFNSLNNNSMKNSSTGQISENDTTRRDSRTTQNNTSSCSTITTNSRYNNNASEINAIRSHINDSSHISNDENSGEFTDDSSQPTMSTSRSKAKESSPEGSKSV